MSSVTVKSFRKEREREIISGLQKGLEKAGLIVERQAKINVTQSPPKHPQVQTGRGRASITHEVSPGEVVIGTNVVYMKIQELGSVRQPPYPWLFPAVELKKPEIIQALKSREFAIE